MLNTVKLARANAPLSPLQRAWLKMLLGFVIAGVVAAAPIASQLLTQAQDVLAGKPITIAWGPTFYAALVAILVGALHAAAKWATAHGDPMLGAVLDTAATTAAADLPPDARAVDGSAPLATPSTPAAPAPAPAPVETPAA